MFSPPPIVSSIYCVSQNYGFTGLTRQSHVLGGLVPPSSVSSIYRVSQNYGFTGLTRQSHVLGGLVPPPTVSSIFCVSQNYGFTGLTRQTSRLRRASPTSNSIYVSEKLRFLINNTSHFVYCITLSISIMYHVSKYHCIII